MVRPSDPIQGSLERALAAVSRDIMIRAIAAMPQDMTLGEFIAAMDGTSFAAEFRALDLAGLHAALGMRAATSPARGSAAARRASSVAMTIATRTASGREALDAAVAACLKAAPAALRSEAIKEATGATPAEIRQALARLMEANLVVKKGEKRATEYRWKGPR